MPVPEGMEWLQHPYVSMGTEIIQGFPDQELQDNKSSDLSTALQCYLVFTSTVHTAQSSLLCCMRIMVTVIEPEQNSVNTLTCDCTELSEVCARDN